MIKRNMLKKLLASILVASFLLTTIFVPIAHARSTWYAPSYDEFTKKVFGGNDIEIFGERYTFAQVHWILYSIPNVIVGSDIGKCYADANPVECMKPLVEENKTGGLNSPILGLAYLNDLVLQTRPASGMEYLADTASDLNIIPEAKAQGFGFKTLGPVLAVWKVTRNFSYALLTIVIIALAFMIMFRVKISPQTAITVQSALPRIVIALILITFSYAIAGLLVDLSFLVQGVVALVAKDLSTLSASELFNELINPGLGHVWSFILLYILTFALLGTVTGLGAAALGATIIGLTGGTAATVIGILAFVVGVAVLVITLIRILWLLLKTYVTVLLLIVAGPFFILFGALNPQGGFGTWLRLLIANLSVFPMVGILVFLANFFAWGFASEGNLLQRLEFLNPFGFETGTLGVGGTSLPSWNVGNANILGLLIGFAIILMIPGVANIVKDLLKIPALPYGAAVTQTLAPIGRYGPAATYYTASELAGERYPFPFSLVTRGRVPGPRAVKAGETIERLLSNWRRITGGRG